jgi:hypothetical protein
MITSPKDYKIYCKLKDVNPHDVKTIMLQTDFQNSDEAYKIKSLYIQAFELLNKMIN